MRRGQMDMWLKIVLIVVAIAALIFGAYIFVPKLVALLKSIFGITTG